VAGFLARATGEYILRYIHPGATPATRIDGKLCRFRPFSAWPRNVHHLPNKGMGRDPKDRRVPRAEEGYLRAASREPGAENEAASAERLAPRTESGGPRAVSREPRTENWAPSAENCGETPEFEAGQ